MKYVKVLYLEPVSMTFGGKAYTYMTTLDDCENLDRVIAPVGYKNERKRACIIDSDVPVETIEPDVLRALKVIKEYDRD